MFYDYTEPGTPEKNPYLLGNKEHRIGASFRLHPSNVTIANTIRRQVLNAVKTVGFRTEPAEQSEVVLQTNTTPLVNEMLAHRIGMIPIKVDPATFDPARYEFHISKENTTKEMMDVHAADFVVLERDPANPQDGGKQVPTETFFPPDPITGSTVLITRLRPQWNPIAPHEKLVLKAKAALSTGAENARWSPVSQCSYEYTRITEEENPELIEQMFEAWALTSKKVKSEELPLRREELRREYNTMEIQRCFRKDAAGEPNDFTFYMESVGILSVPEIVKAALEATVEKLSKYQDLDVDGKLPDNVTVQHADARFPAADVLFQNEDHTLGNLLQHYLVERHVRAEGEEGEEPRISFAAYKVPHPLKPEMYVRVGLQQTQQTQQTQSDDSEEDLKTARIVVAKAVRHLKALFQEILANWMGHTGIAPASAPQHQDQEQPTTPNQGNQGNQGNQSNQGNQGNQGNQSNQQIP